MKRREKKTRRSRKLVILAILIGLCGITGAVAGLVVNHDLPSVKELEHYRPPSVTQVFDASGKPAALLGEEKRIILKFDEIPQNFKDALIATEDARFYDHFGVDAFGLMRAAAGSVKEAHFGAQGGVGRCAHAAAFGPG